MLGQPPPSGHAAGKPRDGAPWRNTGLTGRVRSAPIRRRATDSRQDADVPSGPLQLRMEIRSRTQRRVRLPAMGTTQRSGSIAGTRDATTSSTRTPRAQTHDGLRSAIERRPLPGPATPILIPRARPRQGPWNLTTSVGSDSGVTLSPIATRSLRSVQLSTSRRACCRVIRGVEQVHMLDMLAWAATGEPSDDQSTLRLGLLRW